MDGQPPVAAGGLLLAIVAAACIGALPAGCQSAYQSDRHPIEGLRLFDRQEPERSQTVGEWMGQERPSP